MLLVIQATATTVDEGYVNGRMQSWGEIGLFCSFILLKETSQKT